ncbi:MAG: hypothetical protein NTX03_03560 [Bacteroidetes bacterium]|nr:hypothetical protein [Bacteroidota bacterium]
MKKLILCFCLVILLSACKQGADSLPELSTAVFNSFKSNKNKGLDKFIPDAKGLELYYKLYEPNAFSKDEIKKECKNKAQSNRIRIHNAFDFIYKTIGLNWKLSELKDFKFSVDNHTEGYQTSHCILIITSGNITKKIGFNAIQVQSKWFLKDSIELEK